MQLVLLAGDLGPRWFHIALRALVLIAQSSEPLSSSTIASTLQADSTYIRKIMSRLTKGNLTATVAGRYGGYYLLRSPEEITVLDVYQTLVQTEPVQYDSVPQTGSEHMISMIITSAEKQFQATLKKFTIMDLVNSIEL